MTVTELPFLADAPDLPGIASCRFDRSGIDPNLWDLEGPAIHAWELKLLRSVCGACPVRAACLRWALDHPEETGIWAGTTAAQRHRLQIRACPVCGAELVGVRHRQVTCSRACAKQLYRRRTSTAVGEGLASTGPVKEHGTVSGHRQHMRRQEDACPACRDAHAAECREQRRAGAA